MTADPANGSSQKHDSDPNAEAFLEKEYDNLARAFFELHSNQLKAFHFFLLANAVPLAMVWFFVSKDRQLHTLPIYVFILLLLFSALNQIFMMHISSARIEQYVYARAVNCIRGYYSNKYESIKCYLYMSKSSRFPDLEHLGHINLLIFIVLAAAACYTSLGLYYGARFLGLDFAEVGILREYELLRRVVQACVFFISALMHYFVYRWYKIRTVRLMERFYSGSPTSTSKYFDYPRFEFFP